MKFSIKKKISAILLLSSFLSNVNDNFLAYALDDIDYNVADLSNEKYTTIGNDIKKNYTTLDLDTLELEDALIQYNSDLFSSELKKTGIKGLKLLLYCAGAWYAGQEAASYVPEVHWESEGKQPVLKEVTGEKNGLKNMETYNNMTRNETKWSEIKQAYTTVFNKKIDDNCNSENELAYALKNEKASGFFHQIKCPWAPLGLRGPIFARKGANVETGGAYNLPNNDEDLVEISNSVKGYLAARLEAYYKNLTSLAGAADTIKILGTLEKLLDELNSKNFTQVPKALNSTLNLLEDLLPVLHLFYSISDSSKIGRGLNWGLGFSPRIPVIREENGHKILTTSDYYKSILVAGDRKGTIEIDLSENKIGQKMGMNLYSAIQSEAKTGMFQDIAAKLYAKSAESEGKVKVFSELCGNLKNIISSVRKLLEDNKDLISKLFKTLNGEVFGEIDARENYITNLFGLKTGLKETLLGILNKDEFDLKIKEAERQAKTNLSKNELDEKEIEDVKEKVINEMKIKRINKKYLTEAIKKQLPDLPVFREIGEFFIDKFFDECGFEYGNEAGT